MNTRKVVKRACMALGIIIPILIIVFFVLLHAEMRSIWGWESRINRINNLSELHNILNDYRNDIYVGRTEIRGHRPNNDEVFIDIYIRDRISADTLEEIRNVLFEYFESDEFISWIENHEWFKLEDNSFRISLAFRGLPGGSEFYHRKIQLN